jgi:hypothetical protein
MQKDTILLIKKLSSNPTIKSTVLKSLINFENVYIHSRQIEVAIQEYESSTDYKELNTAVSVEDYSKLKELYKFPVYDKFIQDLKLFCGESKKDKDLVIIPLGITFFDNYKDKIEYTGKHSAVTIINFKTKMIYVVDSDNEETLSNKIKYNESKYEYYLKRKIKACIECIYDYKFKIKIVDTQAPQILTKDIYCIFWSFMITEMIVKEYNETRKISPNLVLRKIIKQCNTKKCLDNMIKKYIKNIFLTT